MMAEPTPEPYGEYEIETMETYPVDAMHSRLIATIRAREAERDKWFDKLIVEQGMTAMYKTAEERALDCNSQAKIRAEQAEDRAEKAEAELAEAQEQANMQAELTEHWQKADAEARALLSDVREACLFDDDDGIIGVTTDPHIDERLFDKICAALNPEPADG